MCNSLYPANAPVALELTCRMCHHVFTVDACPHVNVTLDPSLRDNVFSGKAFIWECPECHESFVFFHDLLYVDDERKFVLCYTVSKYVPHFPSAAEMLKAYEPKTGYTTMRLRDYFDVREKILIFENGLDDEVIQITKAMIKWYPYNQNIPGLKEAELKLCAVRKEENDLVFGLFRDGLPTNQTITQKLMKKSGSPEPLPSRFSGRTRPDRPVR